MVNKSRGSLSVFSVKSLLIVSTVSRRRCWRLGCTGPRCHGGLLPVIWSGVLATRPLLRVVRCRRFAYVDKSWLCCFSRSRSVCSQLTSSGGWRVVTVRARCFDLSSICSTRSLASMTRCVLIWALRSLLLALTACSRTKIGRAKGW